MTQIKSTYRCDVCGKTFDTLKPIELSYRFDGLEGARMGYKHFCSKECAETLREVLDND